MDRGFIRLETGPISFCSPQRAVGSIRGRSVRDTANKSATQVRELETGPRGGSDRRFLSGLVSAKGLRIPPSPPPPFSLVGRCLSQVQEQGTQHPCLVTPVWETQPWYPLLLHLSVDFPRLFPTGPWLLSKEGSHHSLPQLQLAGWLVSANATLRWGFQTRLKDSLSPPGVTRPLAPTSRPGACGVAGAVNKRLIPFLPLFSM